LTALALDWDQNEVQTITPASTWTSGTYTLEVTYNSGSSETTSAIALDADADTIKSALAALTTLSASDLTVTGGPLNDTGPIVPVVVTFGGTYANVNMPMVQIDVGSIIGGGTATVAETTQGMVWTALPDIVSKFDVKPAHAAADHRPLHTPHRTGSVTTDLGIDEITFEIAETDIDAFNLAFPSTLKTTTAAGAGTAGYETLAQPAPSDIDDNIKTLCSVRSGPFATGWGILEQFFRCKRMADQAITEDTGARKLQIRFAVYADPDNSNKCSQKYQYTATATS